MSRVFKRKGSIAGGTQLYKPWKEYTEGDFVIGTYVGNHTDNYGNVCIILEVLDCEFSDDDREKYLSKKLVINSCGTINKCLEENKLEVGKHYQLTYNGLFKITKGKFANKDAHSVEIDEVELDDEGSNDTDLL